MTHVQILFFNHLYFHALNYKHRCVVSVNNSHFKNSLPSSSHNDSLALSLKKCSLEMYIYFWTGNLILQKKLNSQYFGIIYAQCKQRMIQYSGFVDRISQPPGGSDKLSWDAHAHVITQRSQLVMHSIVLITNSKTF